MPDSGRALPTALAAAILIAQATAIAEVWRSRASSTGYTAYVLLAASFAMILAAVLWVIERRSRRILALHAQSNADQMAWAMDAGHAVAWDWDLKSGRDVFFGDLKTMFGLEQLRHVGSVNDFRRYVHEDDREMLWRATADARDNRTLYDVTFRVVWPDGTLRWVAAKGRFHYTAAGVPCRMVGMSTDITDRHLAEQKLSDNQEHLTAIVQSAFDAIVGIDDRQRVTVFNPAAERMFGCTEAEAVGASIDRFIRTRVHPVYGKYRDGVELLWGLRGNVEFPIEASRSHWSLAARRFDTIVIRDVTERYHAEAVLRESEERFRRLADSAPVMLWMTGPDTLCTDVNRAWLEFTGRPMADQLGTGWADAVHPDDRQRSLDTYTKAFNERKGFDMEYRLRRHDGEYRWILDTGGPRFVADGSFAGYMGSAVDVTAHKTAEKALAGVGRKMIEAHEMERTRIARDLHDDIGQRMAVLIMELDGASEALPLNLTEWRARLRTVSAAALELSKDIQAISHRLHSPKLDFLGLASASESACHELSASRPGLDVDFAAHDVPRDLPSDVALSVFRVLQEAVNNVAKHAEARHLSVTLQGFTDRIHLEVADDGIGFDPVAAMNGAGIGLIGMRERLTLVAGELSIESRPGAGSTIRARAPLRRAVRLLTAG